MKLQRGITLAICTRNRHEDLARTFQSVAMQQTDFPVEVLIVDDGELPTELLNSFTLSLNGSLWEMNYHKKQNPGLLLSRIETVRIAKHDIILFIDDDVELYEGYVQRLMRLYDSDPNASGFGGRDVLLGTSFIWRQFCRVFLYGASKPGKLSLSGYGGSMITWVQQKEPFRTEYVVGCNMSFRRSALMDLRPAPWLLGYSVGEDQYLTQCARRHGEVWIDPDLKIIHHQSPLSRDKVEQVAYMDIVNHDYLLRELDAPAWRYACLIWTSLGFLLRALLRREHRAKIPGYLRGVKFVITSNRGRLAHESVIDQSEDHSLRGRFRGMR
ncbi:glycosyltransferase family 2 protein [Cohnella mopanensis]|uniref:glycosyltransferase family 2 protein n=1 Tax=Cohnella mopanensis TaxID=2911966 RepID=UPI001EF7B5B3|nr:glycosyltransferase family 2 protein [Cohnella mopanensis]